MEYTNPSSSQSGLSAIKYAVRESHEELPYFIHAKSNVPYLVGRQAHTVIAVELKKFHWSIKLQQTKENMKDIVAKKSTERWHIRIKTVDARLSDVLRNLPVSAEEIDELIAVCEKEKALPVIAVVASDSAVLLSAKTFKALSP